MSSPSKAAPVSPLAPATVPALAPIAGVRLARAGEAVSAGNWAGGAGGILTNDNFPKLAAQRARIGDTEITINGFAKGSGMIAPDMATMLAYVFTDAKLPADVLQALLSSGN